MGGDRHSRGEPGDKPSRRRRRNAAERQAATPASHGDGDNGGTGMVSVNDLVKRMERDKQSRSGTMFPSAAIPRLTRAGRFGERGRTRGTRPDKDTPGNIGGGTTGRDPMTEILPTVDAAGEPAEDAQETGNLPTRASLPIKLVYAATGICALLVVAFTAYGWNFLRANDNAFRHVSALDENSRDIATPFASAGDDTYLVVGVDPHAEAASDGGPEPNTALLISIPHDRSRVVTLGLPVDMEIHRPQCQGWDHAGSTPTGITYPESDNEKLSAIYALGGPKCLVAAIQKMSGIGVNHFLDVDETGIAPMVDAVGGIRVCSKGVVLDADLGPILPGSGSHHLDGVTAYKFLTARHVDSDTRAGDGLRRRQQFLSGLLDAIWSSVLSPGRLHSFVTALTRHTAVTDVSLRQLLALDRSLEPIGADTMTYVPLPTATADDGGRQPQTSQTTGLFKAIADHTPIPSATTPPAEPAPASVATPVAVDPDGVTVEISNGTAHGRTGSAVAKKLAKYGFTVAGVGTDAGARAKTVIRYGPAQAAAAATLATAIPDAQLEQRRGLGGSVDLILGSDFSGSIQAPTPAGHPITGNAATAFPPPAPAPTPVANTALDQFTAADNGCR